MGGVISSFSGSSCNDSIAARQALEMKLAGGEKAISVLERDLSMKESECTTVYQHVEDLRGKIKELEAQSSSALDETHARGDILSEQLHATKSTQDLNAANAELTALEDKFKTLEQEKKAIIDQLDGLKAELVEVREALESAALNKEIATYKAQTSGSEVNNQTHQQSRDKLEATLAATVATLYEQKRALAGYKEMYATLQQSIDKLKEEYKVQFVSLKSDLARAEDRVVALQQSYDKLKTGSESELASLKAQLQTRPFALEQSDQALEQSNWKLKSDSSELVAAKDVSEWHGNRGALRTTHDDSHSDLEAVEKQLIETKEQKSLFNSQEAKKETSETQAQFRATFTKRDAPEKKLQGQEDSLNDVERQPEIAQANTTDVDEDLKASQMGREALEVKIASL